MKTSTEKQVDQKRALIIVGFALISRVLIDLFIFRAGYYYGEDPDSFWRLGLSWDWSLEPFFSTYHWVPFQFVLVGVTFNLLRLFIDQSSMFVPVVWNHLFFVISLVYIYMAAKRIGGWVAGFCAVVIATTITEDIWTTFSGLSEPLTISCTLAVAYYTLRLIDTKSEGPQKYLLGSGIATLIASSNHYLGWVLLVPVACSVTYYLIRSSKSDICQSGKQRIMICVPLIIAVLFPITWIIMNHVTYGTPFHFLNKAETYHPWISQISVASRILAVPNVLWSTAPILIIIACFAIPFTGRRQSKSLLFLFPGLIYIISLILSSIKGYGVPDMHNRYSLIPIWLSLPFIGFTTAELIRFDRRIWILPGICLMATLVINGISNSFKFTNWVDNDSRVVINLIQKEIDGHDDDQLVFIEDELCLYPVAGIANGISRPDWVRFVSTADLLQMGSRDDGLLKTVDIVVLSNPLTINELIEHLEPIDRVGDYLIANYSDIERHIDVSRSIPEPWQLINEDSLFIADANGSMYFTFNPSPEHIGDSIGLQMSLDVTQNCCYILHTQIQDRFESDSHPWVAVQQLVVNDIVIWSHDISGDKVCGWLPVDVYLMPTTARLDIQFRVVAFTGPNAPVDWRVIALTGIRNISISDCP